MEPKITCEDLIGEIKLTTVYLNGKAYTAEPLLKVNGLPKKKDYVLKDGDSIHFKENVSVDDFLQANKLSYPTEQPFTVWIDDEELVLSDYGRSLYKNGQPTKGDELLSNNDQLETASKEQPKLEEILMHLQIPLKKDLLIRYNNQPLTLTKELVTVTRNGKKIDFTDLVYDGDKLQIQKRKEEPFIFQDIFRFISLDLNSITGKVELLKNGEPVSFFDELQPNDHIEITLN